jgi:cytoskeletal protein RodZ
MPEIGAALREARMRQRIDISEIEAQTKIRAKYLRALENEEWDLLPGPVYVKSFLKTYGDFLGLDSRMLIDEYKRRYERPSDHELRPIATLSRERERASRGPLLPPWLLVAGVLIVVVVVLYLLGNGTGSKNPTTPAAQKPPPVTHHHHRHHRSQTTTPAAPSTVKLQLVPTGTVYVCVVDGNGHRLIPGTIFNVGQTIPAITRDKLLMTLGNASVTMKVNGQTVKVPASSSSIGYLIQPSGTSSLPVSKQPKCA